MISTLSLFLLQESEDMPVQSGSSHNTDEARAPSLSLMEGLKSHCKIAVLQSVAPEVLQSSHSLQATS